MLGTCLWLFCTALALIGCGQALVAFLAVRELRREAEGSSAAARPLGEPQSVTILKPLHGDEPDLGANLASFFDQEHRSAHLQIVCGIQNEDDPAGAVVRALVAARPGRDIVLVVDPAPHGGNAKVSNLINMMPRATGDVIVLADSDIAAPPGYLAAVLAALGRPGVGAVTCLYTGQPGSGPWSRLAALAIDWHFLPNVLLGLWTGIATPCFGSTIALRRETLARIGGFGPLADQLADDYELGRAVRGLGLEVAIPPLLVRHTCAEASFSELFAHELRWARTIRLVDPWGYAGLVFTHPVPFSLMALAIAPGSPFSLGLVALALACRLGLELQVQHVTGGAWAAVALGPVRDLLTFAVFVASFWASVWPGRMIWRGQRFGLDAKGRMTTDAD